ncbi:hypothetical protein K2X33_15960 [bacterium]|nr:hypothetical protein [bacterium]
MRALWLLILLAAPAWGGCEISLLEAYRSSRAVFTQTIPNTCGPIAVTNGVTAALEALGVPLPYEPRAVALAIKQGYPLVNGLSLGHCADATRRLLAKSPKIDFHIELFSADSRDQTKLPFERVTQITPEMLQRPHTGYDVGYTLLYGHFVEDFREHGAHSFLYLGGEGELGLLADPRSGNAVFPTVLRQKAIRFPGHSELFKALVLDPNPLSGVFAYVPQGLRPTVVKGVRVSVRRLPD